MELNDLQKLAIAQAMQNQLKKMLDRHAASSLRSDADDELRELYTSTGADRMRIEINGVEVGTLSLAFEEARRGVEPYIADGNKLVRWLRETDGGLDALNRLMLDGRARQMVLDASMADGELADGVAVREIDHPRRVKHTTLRVKAQKIAEALAGELPGVVTGLLGGGSDD